MLRIALANAPTMTLPVSDWDSLQVLCNIFEPIRNEDGTSAFFKHLEIRSHELSGKLNISTIAQPLCNKLDVLLYNQGIKPQFQIRGDNFNVKFDRSLGPIMDLLSDSDTFFHVNGEGTGPYRLIGNSMIKRKAPQGNGWDHVAYQTFNDGSAMLKALRARKVDLLFEIPHRIAAQELEDLHISSVPSRSTNLIRLNTTTLPLATRRSMIKCVPWDKLFQSLNYGVGKLPTGPLPPSCLGSLAKPIEYPESIIRDTRRCHFCIPNSSSSRRFGEIVASYWRELIGLDVEIHVYNGYAEAIRQAPYVDAMALGLFFSYDPFWGLRNLFHTRATENTMQYSSPHVDTLLAKAAEESNEAARTYCYAEICRQVMVDAVVIPYRHGASLLVSRKDDGPRWYAQPSSLIRISQLTIT
ncbi:MAG: hypothetical protein M1596_02630 [Firmicutes bacterium]|nr:hypothetical protein [Bacillota bacterium]